MATGGRARAITLPTHAASPPPRYVLTVNIIIAPAITLIVAWAGVSVLLILVRWVLDPPLAKRRRAEVENEKRRVLMDAEISCVTAFYYYEYCALCL